MLKMPINQKIKTYNNPEGKYVRLEELVTFLKEQIKASDINA